MGDDKVVRGNFGAEPGDPRTTIISEAPDAPYLRGDNFHPAAAIPGPFDLKAGYALERAGFGLGIPHTQGSKRVDVATLRRWRDWHMEQVLMIRAILSDDGSAS